MNVIDLAIATHRLLEGAGLPHAFGGALALNLYAEPRMTQDVDVSVFVPWEERSTVLPLFDGIGYRPEAPVADAAPIAGVRLVHEDQREVIDVFFALDAVYDRVRDRAVPVEIGLHGEVLPFFTAEDITAFKVSFNRPKDWVDLQSLVRSGTALDLDYIEDLLLDLRGPTMHPRVARLRALVRSGGDLG